jgi:hypothetical protein
MCWGAQAESRWGRKWGRVRGLHVVFAAPTTVDSDSSASSDSK